MNRSIFERLFNIQENGSTFRREILAGIVSYFTIVYITVVNSLILSEAGIPFNGAIVATIVTSAASCILMGFFANVPIILVPGMGLNALFAYTMVQGMGLSWQSALSAVFVSGAIFAFIAFTRFSKVISDSIPNSLKEGISVGLGLFLMFLGLEKGGLITKSASSLLALGSFSDPKVIATALTFIIAISLFIKNVPGSFLITIIAGSIIAYCLGIISFSGVSFKGMDVSSYGDVFMSLSFAEAGRFDFWVAVFIMTMVLVFENIGLVHGHVNSIKRPGQYQKAFQATGISVLISGLAGSSPTVATVETAAGIASGGRTGLTSVITGILFIVSILFIPVIKVIPDSAIAPILIIIGILMMENIKNLNFGDFSESVPAILIIAMIPFTFSIADGMAIGFIMYPILKIVIGKAKEVSPVLYIIGVLFLAYFIISTIS
ncbi:NCS2 family permease [Actinomycetes bacterium NPDC127524]|uniref:NCS2 family permease n=1 Tax=Bacillus sp. OV322 TaxID=1882764 RepID=UPI0008E217DC|nr:NCS2 family permease [Bacillus sp. OV322]SFC77464.1 putative MFS transporter, AGZA family, xanthine/uracil permease [Bacillus sp. OV322]